MNQYKHVRAILIAITISLLLHSQSDAQQTSKRDLQLGLGFNPDYIEFVSPRVPHIQLSWDYRVSDVGPGRVTLGHYFGMALYESDLDLLATDPINYGLLDIGIRAGYALSPMVDGKLEPYGGLQYSYHQIADLTSDEDTSSNTTKLSVLAGMRYRFTDKSGVYLELNPGYTLVKLGVVFKKF